MKMGLGFTGGLNTYQPPVRFALFGLGLIGINLYWWALLGHLAFKDDTAAKFMKDLYVCSPTRYDLFIKGFQYDRYSPYSRTEQLETYMRLCAEQPFRMSVISGCDRH